VSIVHADGGIILNVEVENNVVDVFCDFDHKPLNIKQQKRSVFNCVLFKADKKLNDKGNRWVFSQYR
jgi:hypothetical protein